MSKIMKMIRYFSVAALASLIAHSVWAATPVAVWDGDFSNLTNGDITIDLNGGSCSTDKSTISVGSTGAIKLTADPGEGDYNTTMFSGKTASIVIEYSGYSYSSAVPMLEIYMHQTGSDYGAGVASASANSMKGVWHQPSTTAINRNGDSGSSTTDLTGSTKHVMVLGYDSVSGTTAYVDGVKVFSEGNLKGSGLVPFGFAIGGLYNNVEGIGIASMTISKITIYNKKLTGGDIADANLAEGELPKPRVWNKFDGNFDQIGTQSVTWGDTAASFEASDDGQAVYTGSTNKYPWYQGMDWGLAESFTVMGSFKVAVADGATNPSGLGGIGWSNNGIMLAASANKVYIVKAGSNITGATSISSETLDVDLTAGYHSYVLVATGTKVSAYLDGVKVIDETDMTIPLYGWANNRHSNGGILSLPGGAMSGTVRNPDTRCDEYRVYGMALTAEQINKILEEEKPAKLADDLLWLPIGDSITEGEQYMGHADQGDVNTRGGYRYQLWREMEEEYGQSTISVGYRTGHQGTVEDPLTCHWAWHAAQYGGAIMYDQGGTHGAAGLCLDSTLEVAGYPDVITVLIGVNDCSFGGAVVSKVFDSWVAMITKLSAKRPKSTICVSTLLPAGNNRTYIDTFNTLVRNAVNANEAPFNCANVVFADMHQEAFGGTFDSQYFKGDVLHPNENGAKLIGAAFSKYLKDVVADRATHAAELVSIDNGTAGFVTVRFNKALKSVTSATLTITGTDVEDTPVTLTLTNGAIDATNKRLLKFATSEALKGGTYTATIALAGTDGNGLELPETLSLEDSEFVEILGSGAEANVPAAFRKGLTKHGTLAMGDDNFAGNGPGSQFTTANALPQYVKRVAYYMELKRPGQPAQFVWASMDASTGFGSKSINVGIPTSTSSNVKAIVNNLQVYGNRGNFTNSVIDSEGNSSDQGIVEFTPWTWTANDQSGYPADFNGGKFGWNDTLGTSTLKGCMQIAKILRTTDIDKYTKPAAEMLFAYNNFNCATATDIAIGSFATHRHNSGSDVGVVYDWTDFVSKYAYTKFAADAYEVKSLEIWTEEGEEPQDLYIAAGETVTKSASDQLTLPVRGSGRLVLENYLPTDSTILASLQNGTTWTGTVEIKNYTKPTNDNYGIIYFQNYANANSTVALNGVTSTMFTNGSNHPDQTFGSLEIMEGGWTSHAGDFTVSPLYNCNLKGSGAITINHRAKSGTVYFCGDHSNFSGAINFSADADKGVVLAPAGNARTTTGPAARQILIHANTTVRIAGTANGRVKIAARSSAANFDVNHYGNTATTVELMGINGGHVPNTNTTESPKIVLSGDISFDNGYGGYTTTWSEVSGTGNFSVSKVRAGNQNYVFSTLKGYTGKITAKTYTTLTIGEVVTALEAVPTTATTVVAFGDDCATDKVLITNLKIKLADGTDITEDVTIEKTATGITIVKKAPPYPEYVDPTDPKQTETYNTWKTTHAEALASATELQAKEAYFLNCEPTADALAQAEENFKVTIEIAEDGTVTVSAPEGYNVKPVIKGSATVNGTYELEQDDAAARFFKAFIEL